MRYQLQDRVKAQTLVVNELQHRAKSVVRARIELQIQPGQVLETEHDLSHWVKAGLIDEIVPRPPEPVVVPVVDPVQVYLEAAATAAVAGHAPTMADPRLDSDYVAPVGEAPVAVEQAMSAVRAARKHRKG